MPIIENTIKTFTNIFGGILNIRNISNPNNITKISEELTDFISNFTKEKARQTIGNKRKCNKRKY